MVLGDRLELEGLLLSVVSRQDLVEHDDCAVAVSCRKHEALTVGRPEAKKTMRTQSRQGKSGKAYHVISVNSR